MSESAPAAQIPNKPRYSVLAHTLTTERGRSGQAKRARGSRRKTATTIHRLKIDPPSTPLMTLKSRSMVTQSHTGRCEWAERSERYHWQKTWKDLLQRKLLREDREKIIKPRHRTSHLMTFNTTFVSDKHEKKKVGTSIRALRRIEWNVHLYYYHIFE